MSISTDQNYAGFKRFPAGTMPVEYIFPHYLYNNIVLSMLYAEICPKVRRYNARPELLLLLWMSVVI
jgi:hypothetical protein